MSSAYSQLQGMVQALEEEITALPQGIPDYGIPKEGPSRTPSSDVDAVLGLLHQQVEHELTRFREGASSPPKIEAINEDDVRGIFAGHTRLRLSDVLVPAAPLPDSLNRDVHTALHHSLRNLCHHLATEATYFQAQRDMYKFSASSLQKMQRAVETLNQNKPSEALTVLREAQRTEPNNLGLNYLLGQLLYFMVFRGKKEFLPEARDHMKKCCAFSEGIDELQVQKMRYLYVVNEYGLDNARCMELMREYYLLNPEAMTSKEGFTARAGYPLKSWIMLSKISLKNWQPFEFESLLSVARESIGGALMYLLFFHAKLAAELSQDNPFAPGFNVLHEELGRFQLTVSGIHSRLRDIFTDDAKPRQGTTTMPWTVHMRYFQTMLQLVPLPNWDHILLHASLDGRQSLQDVYPDRRLQKMDLTGLSFWRVWIQATTPSPRYITESTIPATMASQDNGFRPKLDTLLEKMQQTEQEISAEYTAEELAESARILDPYTFELIVNIGYNKPQARELLKHKEPLFQGYSRNWAKSIKPALYPSKILEQAATRGVFASPKELLVTLKGCLLLLDKKDNRSLPARLEMAKNRKSGGLTILRGGSNVSASGWWLLPAGMLSMVTFYLVIQAESKQQAINAMLMMLGIVIFLLITFIIFTRKPKRRPPVPPSAPQPPKR